jgi:hypothetical protein
MASIAQRLVRPIVVVPPDPRLHRLARLGEVVEHVLPDALLFEAPEERSIIRSAPACTA